MKLSISEVIAGPGLWGMSGTFIAGSPTTPVMKIGECGRGRFDVGVSKLGPSGVIGLFVGRDISTNEILGLSGLGLVGTDITGGLPFIAGLDILFRVGIGILGIGGSIPIGGRGILGISGLGKLCMVGKSGLESAGMFEVSGLVLAGLSSISGSENA